MDDRRGDRWVWLGLSAAVALTTLPLLAGRVLYYGDITLQCVPWRTFAREQLLRGTLPWWLPTLYGGLPLVGNDQSAVFYPWYWLSLGLSPARQLALGCVLHVWLGVAGAYLLARTLGRGRAAGLVTALAFGLSGWLVSKQQFPSLAYTTAWLPWLVWAGLRLWAAPGLAWALVLSGLVGLQWLSGHAQMSFLQLCLTAAVLAASRGEGPAPRRWAWALGAVALGCGLGLVQVLPTLELLRWSPRANYRFEDVARFYLPLYQLPMLLWPRWFGSPEGPLPYLGIGAYWELLWYVGIPTLPLSLAAARRQPGWAALGLLGVLLAMGPATPVYGWLFRLLPPVRMFRDPARFELFGVVALAVLAGYGLDHERPRARRCAQWLAGVCLAGGLVAALAPPSVAQAALRRLLAAQVGKTVGDLPRVAAAWSGEVTLGLLGAALLAGATAVLLGDESARARWAVVALLAADLAWHGQPLNPTTSAAEFGADPRPSAVAAQTAPVLVRPAALPALCARYFNMSAVPRPHSPSGARAALLPDVTAATSTRLLNGYDPLAPAAVVSWLRQLDALPDPARARALADLGAAGEWDGEHWRPTVSPRPQAELAGVAVAGSAPTPQRRLLTLDTPRAGELRLLDAALPGWHCDAGERRAAAVPVESRWRVPRPVSRVRLWYAPAVARVGLFGSLLALATVAGLLTGGVSRSENVHTPRA